MENAYVGFASLGVGVAILRRPWGYGGQVGIGIDVWE